MTSFLEYFIAFPLLGFVISLFLPPKKENLISWTSFITVGMHFFSFLVFLAYWLWSGLPELNLKDLVVFKSEHYEFFIDFYFDTVSAVYMLVGSFLTFLVTLYSRYYMHREAGYKRFFNTILFFYIGYNFIVLAGNMETLFIGWEMLGVSSFLLIAFYRERYLPVKNAVKVFSIYRIGDVGLILAMWMSHHLFQENITFEKLHNAQLVHDHLLQHSWIGIFISLMVLISAAAKSAQFPFSSWLPRAMEGPTPSSAIFYGSLSVHLGVFLMLRTYPLWQEQLSVRILIGLMGLTTALIATGIARVQSSVKSQIAYASIAQIGLIFIEIAAGLQYLALFHFAGNAFLRTYQLLVSPSVVSYLIREQFYTFTPHKITIEDTLPKRLEYSLYLLCIKEWNLDSMMYRYLWNPVKAIGRKMGFLTTEKVLLFFIPVYVLGAISLNYEDSIPPAVHQGLPIFFSMIGLLMVLKAFTERIHARMSWVMIMMNHFWVALAISFNERFTFLHTFWYLSGVTVAGIIGYLSLRRLNLLEGSINLDQFHGYSYHHKRLGFVFLMASLAAMGFPITPTFIGEDLIFTHIHEDQVALATIVALSFIIDGLAIIRIYARVFLGPHVKSVYEMAYRSS
jgi:NADH:ubiquinone oxidoreductase subunit 5 (subunit L)/multisubunit Na+/H+ antiporter MnhA subunit